MIALNTKQQTPTEGSPLLLSQKEKKTSLSFASLLNGIEVPIIEKKRSSKGLVLTLDRENKENTPTQEKKTLQSGVFNILKVQKHEESKGIDDALQLNPKVTVSMGIGELKTIITKAKHYIKSQIMQTEGFKKQEIASLPKTLKGLVQVAKKIGIDISKITVEKVAQMPIEKSAKAPQPIKAIKNSASLVEKKESIATKKQTTPLFKMQSIKETPKLKTVIAQMTKSKGVASVKRTEINRAINKEVSSKEKPKVKDDFIQTANKNIEKPLKQEVPLDKTETNREINKEVSSKEKPKVKDDFIQTANKNIEKPLQEDTLFATKSEEKKPLKQEIPLYKTETNRAITTQELVSVKSGQHDETIPKEIKPMQNLEQLLQEDKVSHRAKVKRDLKGNFSMPTAKVVTPKMDTKRVETLETVLNEKGDEKSELHEKIGIASSVKTEGLEVKMHEAKQMVKYLSHDVKNAIDEYKSPFTRVKVDLNPQKLGEIELTVVQRGKNLHINLSSNNTAIHTLAMNLNDLKIQLNNNGINNASFTFNNNTQSGDSSFGSQAQQQHQQQKEHARSEYSYGEREERNEEILSSLEIVVPHYA